ncbi:hypothetical protein Sgly_2657 [Syntrophobotulus glycolicus DSM 8271]|uniref:Uncharacterized protein n=1 Tax=Syntrophobotulus glycolicus (strain DSM 8271 / FlGlyR) TaxID=645991 RepID=F0SX74_SYNGF|nr:hypothetical protein [Syntrophobotulus glycolicus]ADY56934.1 hypothetical protein Sgly_2657 [Syntrophobotulus glycolicus DSM 8271]
MNTTLFASRENVFANYCECIKGYAFKNAAVGENCALLPVICAGIGLSQDNYAQFGRFECLLPHHSFA